jgi:hypothetical protein
MVILWSSAGYVAVRHPGVRCPTPGCFKRRIATLRGGEELAVVDEPPDGVPAYDLPSQPAVFAPEYAPEDIAEIAEKLRVRAGLSKPNW